MQDKGYKIRVSFDIGGVLSKYPEIFRPIVNILAESYSVEVFVITDMHDHEACVKMIHDNGFNIKSDHIINSDYETYGELCKAKAIEENEIDLHIDDFAGYCMHAKCLSLMTWPNPYKPYYSESWNTDGSEGNFGRHAVSPSSVSLIDVRDQHAKNTEITRQIQAEHGIVLKDL